MLTNNSNEYPEIVETRKRGIAVALEFVRSNEPKVVIKLQIERIPRVFECVIVTFLGDYLITTNRVTSGWYRVRSVYGEGHGDKIIRLEYLPTHKARRMPEPGYQSYFVRVESDPLPT